MFNLYLFLDVSIKESNKVRSPAYTFGSRHEKKSTASAPAPNAYNTSGLNPRGKTNHFTPATVPFLLKIQCKQCMNKNRRLPT